MRTKRRLKENSVQLPPVSSGSVWQIFEPRKHPKT